MYTRTDQADSRRGYRIKYFTGCSVVINRANGTIESPAYGVGRYPASQVLSYAQNKTENILDWLYLTWTRKKNESILVIL